MNYDPRDKVWYLPSYGKVGEPGVVIRSAGKGTYFVKFADSESGKACREDTLVLQDDAERKRREDEERRAQAEQAFAASPEVAELLA